MEYLKVCRRIAKLRLDPTKREQMNLEIATRNGLSRELAQFTEAELSKEFSKTAIEVIPDQATKTESKDPGPYLKEHLGLILEKLFPEGPTRSDSRELRFGKSGSLSVSKDGLFYDYEKGEGGGILKLVGQRIGVNSQGALDWVKERVGDGNVSAPVCSTPQPEWISLLPDSKVPAPGPRETEDGFKETARYAYRDKFGNLLYYFVRLEDGRGNKRVLPFSFGHPRGKENNRFWRLKSYDFKGKLRPMYNLHYLQTDPQAPVVIPEGEKATDAAPGVLMKLGFEKHIAVTWSGGAKAVGKTDWSPLAGRNIVLWPDNDDAGFKAISVLEKLLLGVGLDVKVVNESWLRRTFPKGWDLTDH